MIKTFNLVSLGCPKNLVDSEVMYGLLEGHGWTGVDDPTDAALLLINTCGFIQPAVEESIAEILQLLEYKLADPDIKIVVTGCLVQRYRNKLETELPEVDLFIGTEGSGNIHLLLETLVTGTIEQRVIIPDAYLMEASAPRRLSTPFFRAWLKITEGCDNHCSYCLIPSIRGRLRSREIGDLVREAQILEQQGVKEISLVAQDLTAYGDDLDQKTDLVSFLQALLGKTTVPWVRLMYLYPTGVSNQLLELMASEPRIVPYMDIPLQHVSDHLLTAMNRRYGFRQIEELFGRVRSYLPEVALRTTFLVGFPGETDDDIAQLKSFIRTRHIDHVGVFAYANEEGCPAEGYGKQIDEDVKESRLEDVAALQAQVSTKILQKFVGRTEPVMVEGLSSETDLLLAGRTRFQAPDIDGCVLINDGIANPGDILEIEITEAQIYDLVGRIKDTGA
jgi:ribosomal protein S12 methylthiotransferase